MTKEEFKEKVDVGTIIYNTDKEQIVTICSSWIRGTRNGSGFTESRHFRIEEDDLDRWHIADDKSPLFVRFEILKREFHDLKKFVHERLK